VNQYTHDQYFLAIINDQRSAKEIQRRVAHSAPLKTAVRDMCWRLCQDHNLRPIGTPENNALCEALTTYYQSEMENTIERYKREAEKWQAQAEQYVSVVTSIPTNRHSVTGVADHVIDAMSHTPPKEEPTMARAPAFETKHFVDGQDATTITDEGLIHAIRRLETEIEALGEIKTKSNKIAIKVEELNKQREAIAALLDSRP